MASIVHQNLYKVELVYTKVTIRLHSFILPEVNVFVDPVCQVLEGIIQSI